MRATLREKGESLDTAHLQKTPGEGPILPILELVTRRFFSLLPMPTIHDSLFMYATYLLDEKDFQRNADAIFEDLKRRMLTAGDEHGFDVEGESGKLEVVFEDPRRLNPLLAPLGQTKGKREFRNVRHERRHSHQQCPRRDFDPLERLFLPGYEELIHTHASDSGGRQGFTRFQAHRTLLFSIIPNRYERLHLLG